MVRLRRSRKNSIFKATTLVGVSFFLLIGCGGGGGGGASSSGSTNPGGGTSDAKPTFSTSVTSINLTEGDTPVFVISVNGSLKVNTVIDWSIPGGDSDFPTTSGQVSLAAGSNQFVVNASTIDDTVYELQKAYTFVISNPDNLFETSTLSIDLVLADNDLAPQVSASDVTLTEGSSGAIDIVLDHPAEMDITVDWSSVAGSATAVDDYDLGASGSVTIPALSTSVSLPFSAVSDAWVESSEVFQVTISSPSVGTLGTDTALVTLVDNNGVANASFSLADQTVAENQGTAVTVMLNIDRLVDSVVTVPYTVSGTAANPDLHDLSSGIFTITSGNLSATVDINLLNNGIYQGDKTIILTLGTPTNAVVVSPSIHTITLTDDEPIPTVQFTSATQANISESGGSVLAGVQLSHGSATDITLNYSFSGTPVPAVDFDNSVTSLVISAGQTTGTITVGIIDDSYDSPDRDLTISLGAATGATASGQTSTTVTILDDDVAPDISLTAVTNFEGCGAVVLAKLSTYSERDINFTYGTADGTALAGSDYAVTSGSGQIPAMNLSRGFSVDLLLDGLADSDETLSASILTVDYANIIGASTTTVTIKDHDVSLVRTKLNPALPAGVTSVTEMKTSPDNCYVVYRADQETSGVSELYRSNYFGSGYFKVNGSLVLNGDVLGFKISPDSKNIIYQADEEVDSQNELYMTSFDNSSHQKLNSAIGQIYGDVLSYDFSPDSSFVVYRADTDVDYETNAYSVKVSDGTISSLNDPLVSGGCIGIAPMITNDSTKAVYYGTLLNTSENDLFSANVDGTGSPIRLNPDAAHVATVSKAAVTPDSSKVIFFSDHEFDGVFQLYSVPIDGSSAEVRINAALASDSSIDISTTNFGISSDSQYISYATIDAGLLVERDLFVADLNGTSQVIVSPTGKDLNAEIFNPQFAEDNSKIFFVSEETDSSMRNLYSNNLVGTDLKTLAAGTCDSGVYPTSYKVVSDGLGAPQYVLYNSCRDNSTAPIQNELYSIDAAGVNPVVQLSDSLVESQGDGVFYIDSTGMNVIFGEKANDGLGDRLFKRDVAGVGAATEILPSTVRVKKIIEPLWSRNLIIHSSDIDSPGTIWDVFVESIP